MQFRLIKVLEGTWKKHPKIYALKPQKNLLLDTRKANHHNL